MNEPRKQPQPHEQVTAHPETQKAPQKVPDDRASEATTSPKPDARTGHDKDGNQEQPDAGRKAG